MEIFHSFEEYGLTLGPSVLTIGNFDGVHRGHQKVIQKVVESAKEINGTAAVITFSNHPLEVLRPEIPIKFICTPLHKTRLMENLGIELLFNLTFTREFSDQNPETFLLNIKKHIDFKKIILGYDAKIGKEREGNKEKIIELSKKMKFDVEYLTPLHANEIPVSSSLIRDSINKGKFDTAKKFLGRPYSILSSIISTEQLGTKAMIDVSRLSLPPHGKYSVELVYEGIRRQGSAEVSFASTIEVNFIDNTPLLIGNEIEVFFS